MKTIKIHPSDNVAVALENIAEGELVTVEGFSVTATQNIARGHKIALKKIAEGTPVVKYGNEIAIATRDIEVGEWVHTHNVRTGLSEGGE